MLGAEKKQKILNLILNMKCEQCVLLGLMGMARTTQLGKHIATHYNFEHASDFSIYIHGGLKKLLYNDMGINKKIDKGICLCNWFIPILNHYDFSDNYNEQDSCLMGLAHSYIERWYYFIEELPGSFRTKNNRQIARYATIPAEFIFTYLCDLYQIEDLKDKRAEEHPIFLNEIRIIDDDIKYVQEKHSNIEIKKRVKEYMKYKFWE